MEQVGEEEEQDETGWTQEEEEEEAQQAEVGPDKLHTVDVGLTSLTSASKLMYRYTNPRLYPQSLSLSLRLFFSLTLSLSLSLSHTHTQNAQLPSSVQCLD